MTVVNEVPLPGIGVRADRGLDPGRAARRLGPPGPGIAVAGGAEPDLGPLAACYVLLLAVCGPLLARIADRPAQRASLPG